MKRRILAGMLAGALAVSLSACSNGDADSQPSASASASVSDSASAETAAPEAPEVLVSSDGMPTVKTGGEIPEIVFPDSDAPEGLQVAVLEEGDGRELASTDWITAHYVGAVWGADEPFDSSYSRGEPMTVALGQLVTGWAYGLEGRHVGDKVMLSIPSDYGYGDEGQPAAGIEGGDTIVFYIEILDAWGIDATGEADAKVEADAAALPAEFDAKPGEPVESLTVKDGEAEPTELKMTMIARGTGKEIGEDSVFYYQVAQTYWDNSLAVSTWSAENGQAAGPQMGQAGQSELLDSLIGVPAGSRVLLEIPGTSENETSASPPVAAVLDVIAVQ